MGLKIKGLEARREKRLKWSRDAVRAKERIRQERINAEAEQETREWKPPERVKLPEARIIIEIPGLPRKVIKVTKFQGREVLAMGKITTPKQLGRRIGLLIDQFLGS